MGNYLSTKLDAAQVVRRAYDEPSNRIRVDAEVTAVIGTVDVIINAATDNIAIASPGGNFLLINPDGSININAVIDAASDSIRIGNGTGDYLAINPDGSTNSIELNSLVPYAYNQILPTYPDSVTEIYVYKQDATTVATVTVIYVDSTKNELISVVRT